MSVPTRIELETERPIEAGALVGVGPDGMAVALSEPDLKRVVAVAQEDIPPGPFHVLPQVGQAWRKAPAE